MKLYYSPGACSLAAHIALCEAGVDFEAVKVDGRAKKAANGEDFLAVTGRDSRQFGAPVGQLGDLATQVGELTVGLLLIAA